MVEGSKELGINVKPAAPAKKFYKKESQVEDEVISVPSIPPRPMMAPKLPVKLSTNYNTRVINKTLYPLEDNIYTGLKPEISVSKFYANTPAIPTVSQNGQNLPITIPNDFIPKAFVNDNSLLGLQHGKITQFCTEKLLSSNESNLNRQFYEFIPLKFKNNSFFAFQDTGNIFKVLFQDGNLTFSFVLGNSIPMGTSKILQRPDMDELWVIGMRETCILSIDTKAESISLIKKVPNHFPEAINVSFLYSEEIAVIQRDRSIKIFSVARHGHQPALIAILPSIIGDLVKVFKVSKAGCDKSAYGTVYSDGKMIIWKFEKDFLAEKITVPLTLFRIQTVHIVSDYIWLGLSNGKLLIIQLLGQERQIILAESKFHQGAITRFIKMEGQGLVTIDSSGQLCTWDENLTFYKQNRAIWEKEIEFCRYERVSLRICSWNVAAQNPFDCTENILQKWISSESEKMEDLIIFSLQEIVDLNAKSFISGSSNGNGMNQSQSALDQWIRFIMKQLSNEYKLIHSSVMVGLALVVFCRESIRNVLSSVSHTAVKTGLGGLHGNKGGLIWRAFIYDSPVAFVACHLAAGQAAVSERNNDVATILRTANLPEATSSRKDPFAFPTGNPGTRLFDHSALFIAGDLNYRIEMDRTSCLDQIVKGNYCELEEKDQLKSQMNRKELLLSYFREQQPKFAPTYKYDRGTVDKFDSSEKARVPAWCDRILVYSKKSETVQMHKYNSIPEATLSDHKPIHATFELKCRKIDRNCRSKFE